MFITFTFFMSSLYFTYVSALDVLLEQIELVEVVDSDVFHVLVHVGNGELSCNFNTYL